MSDTGLDLKAWNESFEQKLHYLAQAEGLLPVAKILDELNTKLDHLYMVVEQLAARTAPLPMGPIEEMALQKIHGAEMDDPDKPTTRGEVGEVIDQYLRSLAQVNDGIAIHEGQLQEMADTINEHTKWIMGFEQHVLGVDHAAAEDVPGGDDDGQEQGED